MISITVSPQSQNNCSFSKFEPPPKKVSYVLSLSGPPLSTLPNLGSQLSLMFTNSTYHLMTADNTSFLA